MSRISSAERGAAGPALRWAGAGALVLGVHLGAGTLLLGRSMLPRQPDAAVVGVPIDLEPVTVPQDEPAPAPPPPAASPAAPPPETPAAAEPPPAAQVSAPPPVDPAPAETRVATAEAPPAPAIPPDTPPAPPQPQAAAEPPSPPPPIHLPDAPKARKTDEAVLARPPPPRPRPKVKPVAALPKKFADYAAEGAERRDAVEREAARQRAAERRAVAATAAPAREPAEAQPRASAGEVASWRGALVAHLNRFKRSPPGGGSGTVRVSFSVTASGGLAGVRLASSSGDPALDEAALTMVQRADPMPAPPSGMGARVSLSVPVHFSGP